MQFGLPLNLPVGHQSNAAFHPETNRYFYNGYTWDADDASSALEARREGGKQPFTAPSGAGWTPIHRAGLDSYWNTIENPSAWQLFKKNFGIGVDSMQLLWNRGLQFAGAEEFGQRGVDRNVEDLYYKQPFQREFTDIEGAGDAVDWFAAAVGQAGPSILESLAAAGAGFVAGSAVGTPLAGIGGSAAAMFGRAATKKAITETLKKRAAGEVLDQGEERLLRRAAGIAGSTIASVANSYGLGVADVYGELRDQGADASSGTARAAALGAGVPYAALDLAPEALLLRNFLSGTAGGLAKRVFRGAGIGAVGEGIAEGGQEGVLIGTGTAMGYGDAYEGEVADRLINAAAAGAAPGLLFGGASGISRQATPDSIEYTPEPGSEGAPLALPPPPPSTPPGGVFSPGLPTPGGSPSFTPNMPEPGNPTAPRQAGSQAPPADAPLGLPAPDTPLGLPAPSGPAAIGGLPSGPTTTEPIAPWETAAPVVEPGIEFDLTPNIERVGQRLAELGVGLPSQQQAVAPRSVPEYFLDRYTSGRATGGPGLTDPARDRLRIMAQAETAPPAAIPPRQQVAEVSQVIDASLQDQTFDDLTGVFDAALAEPELPSNVVPIDTLRRHAGAEPASPFRATRITPQTTIPGLEEDVARMPRAERTKRVRSYLRDSANRELPVSERGWPEGMSLENTENVFQGLAKATKSARHRGVRFDRMPPAAQQAFSLWVGMTDGTIGLDSAGRRRLATVVPMLGKPLNIARFKEFINDYLIDDALSGQPVQYPGFPDLQQIEDGLYFQNRDTYQQAQKNLQYGVGQAEGGFPPGLTYGRVSAMFDDLLRQVMDANPKQLPMAFYHLPPKDQQSFALWTAVSSGQLEVTEGSPELMQTFGRVNQASTAGVNEFKQVIKRAKGKETPFPGFPDWSRLGLRPTQRQDAEVGMARDRWAAAMQGTRFSDVLEDYPQQMVNEWLASDAMSDDADQAILQQTATDLIATHVADTQLNDVLDTEVLWNDNAPSFLPRVNAMRGNLKRGEELNIERVRDLIDDEGSISPTQLQQMFWMEMAPGLRDSFAVETAARQLDAVKNNPLYAPSFFRFPVHQIADFLLLPRAERDYAAPIRMAREWYDANKDSMTPAQKGMFDEAVVNEINVRGMNNGIVASRRGNPLPWYNYVTDEGLTHMVTSKINAKPDTWNSYKWGYDAIAEAEKIKAVRRQMEGLLSGLSEQEKDEQLDALDAQDVREVAPITLPSDTMSNGTIRQMYRQANATDARPSRKAIQNMVDRVLAGLSPTVRDNVTVTVRDEGQANVLGEVFIEDGKATVILNRSNLNSMQAAEFTLMHELVGHYGIGTLFGGDAEMTARVNQAVASSPRLAAEAERLMEQYGFDQDLANEEVIADYAATLETSVLRRLWAKLKDLLNRVGITFEDDLARYMFWQARRNLREGRATHRTTPTGIARQMQRMQDQAAYGPDMYGQTGPELGSTAFATNGLGRTTGKYNGFLGAAQAMRDMAPGAAAGLRERIDTVLENFQTSDNLASRSEGMERVFSVMRRKKNKVMAMLGTFQQQQKFTHQLFGGPTREDRLKYSEMAAHITLHAAQNMGGKLNGLASLVTVDANGNYIRNKAAFDEAVARNTYHPSDLKKGLVLTLPDGSKVRYRADVKEDDASWKLLQEAQRSIRAAEMEVLLAKYRAREDNKARRMSELADRVAGTEGGLTDNDVKTLETVYNHYVDLYFEGMKTTEDGIVTNPASTRRAEAFLRAATRATVSKEQLQDWIERNDRPVTLEHIGFSDVELSSFGAQFDDMVDGLSRINHLELEQRHMYTIQKTLRFMANTETNVRNAEYSAKRTIAGAYFPLARRGRWQVRMQAVAADGRSVALHEDFAGMMPYFRTESQAEADQLLKELNDLMEPPSGKDGWLVRAASDRPDERTPVRFVANKSVAVLSAPLGDTISYENFVATLADLDISVTPQDRERITNALANKASPVVHNLKRFGNPGWDKDMVRNVSEHLETKAYVIAKTLYDGELDHIMVTDRYWRGDDAKLERLQQNLAEAKTPEQVEIARKAHDRYQWQYYNSADIAEGRTVNMNGKQVRTKGRGEQYRENAKKLRRDVERTGDIIDDIDMLSQGLGSDARLATTLMQLGGNIATAFSNMVSVPLNLVGYLSYYNGRRGYGGGYGLGRTASAIGSAARNMSSARLHDQDYLTRLAADPALQRKHGISQREAQVLLDFSLDGRLDAAQANALLGTSKGNIHSNVLSGGIRAWMSAFTYTEQLNRRITLMSSFRLAHDRALASGMNPEKAYEFARGEADRALDATQGEYALFNRPSLFRGNLLQYLFVYKMPAVIMVQAFAQAPFQSKLYLTATILLLSGVKGMPFAEDLLDLADTLMQFFGIKRASVEKAVLEMSEGVMPGLGPKVLRGVLDQYVGATISTRVGFGDIFPATGIGVAGGGNVHDVVDFFGPVASGITGAVQTGTDLTRYGLQSLGVLPDKIRFRQILRESPIAAVKALTDSYSYAVDGTITNARGQTLVENAGLMETLSRSVGFYPSRATHSFDVIRMGKRETAYIREIKKGYVDAYAEAAVRKDRSRMSDIRSMVRDHNKATRGTPYQIRNFQQSANRAVREWRYSILERTARSSPRNFRDFYDAAGEMYDLN